MHMVNKKPGPDYKTYFLLGLNIPRGDLSPAPVPKLKKKKRIASTIIIRRSQSYDNC